MYSLKTFIVPKLAMVMLAAMALSTQSLAAGGGVHLPGLSAATPGNTVLCFDSGTEQLGPCAPAAAGTPPCIDPDNRFMDCGDGTVYDKQTGLMWEKKLASTDAACLDATQANRDVRCMLNTYYWTDATGGTAANGTLYTDFLVKLNLDSTDDPSKTCFANHCDWRIPTIVELQTLVALCTVTSCTDPIFGPSRGYYDWSSSSLASTPISAWTIGFGAISNWSKHNPFHARAVRGGR